MNRYLQSIKTKCLFTLISAILFSVIFPQKSYAQYAQPYGYPYSNYSQYYYPQNPYYYNNNYNYQANQKHPFLSFATSLLSSYAYNNNSSQTNCQNQYQNQFQYQNQYNPNYNSNLGNDLTLIPQQSSEQAYISNFSLENNTNIPQEANDFDRLNTDF